MLASHRIRIVALAATAVLCRLSIAFGFSSTLPFGVSPATSASRLQLVATPTATPQRQPFITGNWKLNPATKSEAIQLAREIAAHVNPSTTANVAIFVPFPFLEPVMAAIGDSQILVGAEMVTPEVKGAFTGAISATMLKSIGVQWVLAGHSERRTINKESDDYINAQCQQIIKNGMNVILCVGETLTEFERNLAGPICAIQLKKGLAGVSAQQVVDQVCIAYEPVWAIGTGKVATPEIAQDVHATCRSILAEMYGQQVSEQIRILYGGSVGPESVDGLMEKPDIDGCLVGGASLSGNKFGRIINYLVSTPTLPLLDEKVPITSVSTTPSATLSRLGRLTNSIKRILRKA